MTSIVVMTDGENTEGIGLDALLKAIPPAAKGVRTFAIKFGEADASELERLAQATGGAVFDATGGGLAKAFKEILASSDRPESRLARYLTSNQNLAGSIGALIGLVLLFTGVVGSLWPLVVLGLYGAGGLAVPPSRRGQLGALARLGPDDLRRAMDRFERRISGEVPHEVLMAVRRIDRGVRELLDRRGELPSASADAFAIERTVVDYLPTAVDAYLRLPRTYADTTPVDGDRTALRVLTDQLALLEQRVSAVIADLSRGDAEKLLAHERFLRERFSAPPSELTLPPG